jgi:hypothetical protein
MWKYYKGSFIISILGLAAGAWVGHYYTGATSGALNALFLVTVLSVLEVSLSFDNAVVNAVVLKKMTPIWQKRFLTWGMLIAVFGMRFLFPLLIVAVVASIGPIEALKIAAQRPDDYAKLMLSAHIPVAAFGGAFLMMVALKYFVDSEKEDHWISFIEKPLAKLGKIEAMEIGLVLIFFTAFSYNFGNEERLSMIMAALWGVITFVVVDAIGAVLSASGESSGNLERSSIGMFLYLNVLDSSFSFDGVVGAFAITNNLFIIMLGLGIGALFVRSMTIMMVEKGTIAQFKYLEHGAFYAIFALSAIMFCDTIFHIPEIFTGLIGAVFIGLSLWSSIKANKEALQPARH